MSTPLTTFAHLDGAQPRSKAANSVQSFTMTHFGQQEKTLPIRHYSIHLVIKGSVRYQVDYQRLWVRSGQYLLLNPDQEVQVAARGEHVVCVFQLSHSMLEQALQTLRYAPDWHRLQACLRPERRIELCEQVYEAPASPLGQLLMNIAAPNRDETSPKVPHIQEVAEELIQLQAQAYRQLLSLTSAKLSTKRELYRRLCMARMHIHTHLDEVLDLDTLAQVACLSKYHFIRLFKEAFGQTPRQYLIARRLERASTLLIHSHKTFHEICQEVGLKDSSSFGRLFKRNFGATPHLYRQMHAVH